MLLPSWLLSLSFLCGLVSSQIDPNYAVNLTLYHVNPANYSGIKNMNTADAIGDAFFDLQSRMSPLICANKSQHHWPGQCSNPEVIAKDLAITRVLVQVDSRYGPYGRCNICVDGTVPMSNPPQPCKDGTYHCVCGGWHKSAPCNGSVGREDIYQIFGYKPRKGSSKYSYYLYNLVRRLKGSWYSTTEEGEGKYWQLLEEEEKVDAGCQIEALDASLHSLSPNCFDGCPQPHNRTSECVVDCAYKAMLGDKAGEKVTTFDGLSGKEITQLWSHKFGCNEI
eukprot:jgi/Bigna1/87831/estExt_fgenesh1_pg.C_240198